MNCHSRPGPAAGSVAEQVKAAVPMRAAAERYGFSPDRGGYIACPFHADKTPSLKLYDRPGKGFYCYGCHTGGSVIDFVMKLLGLDFRAAAVRLATDFGILIDTEPRPRGELLAARTAQTERQRRAAEYLRLTARWRHLVDVIRERAPVEPEENWDPEWCAALRELPAVEHNIERMEADGFGR